MERLTNTDVDRLVEDDTNNTYVYGFTGGEQLAEVMPMADVLARVDRCVEIGNPAMCMADPELAAFSKTHPKIFAAVSAGDKKMIRLVRSLVETKARCETCPEDTDREMTNLHLQWMGFGRKDRRKMMRNVHKARERLQAETRRRQKK